MVGIRRCFTVWVMSMRRVFSRMGEAKAANCCCLEFEFALVVARLCLKTEKILVARRQ